MEYHAFFAARARDLCYLGASEATIASLLGCSVTTLQAWRERYPEFDYAWKEGRKYADAKVAASLFRRTQGYEYTKWKETKDGKFQELVHVPADVGACVFWLTNRCPEEWQSKVEHNVGNSGNIPLDTLTEIEAARRIAFALSKAMNNLIEDKTGSTEHGDSRPATSEAE